MFKYYKTILFFFILMISFLGTNIKADYNTLAYDYKFNDIDGNVLILNKFKNNVIVVINVASQCGFTKQYEDMQKVWNKYQDKGVVILGVPSNDFGKQEPGSNKEIKKFCEAKFGITFPMTEKVSVKGENAHPFYVWASENHGKSAIPKWNFHKIIINKQGKVEETFASITNPSSSKFINALEKAINKQKKFMDGDIAKKKVSKKDKASLDAVEAAGMEYREVGKDLENYYTGKKTPTKVIVVKNFNKELINSETVDMVSKWQGDNYGTDGYRYAETYIEDGIRLGTILGRKLQVRGESRETKYTRKLNGSIDKRLIAELGFGNENVFSKTFLDNYPDAHLHISVDASGSMSGDKWTKTHPDAAKMFKKLAFTTGQIGAMAAYVDVDKMSHEDAAKKWLKKNKKVWKAFTK